LLRQAVGRQRLWRQKDPDAIRLLRWLRTSEAVALPAAEGAAASSPPAFRRIDAFADPADAGFRHVHGDAAALYPPPLYRSDSAVLEAMRQCGLQSLADPVVFCRTARAIEQTPPDLAAGRLLCDFLATRQGTLPWSAADWQAALALPWLPAHRLHACALPPAELVALPTAAAARAVQKRWSAKATSKGQKSRRAGGWGGKADGGYDATVGGSVGGYDRAALDDYAEDYGDDEGEDDLLDDISAGETLAEAERRMAAVSTCPRPGGGLAPALLSAREVVGGGAVVAAFAWTRWTSAAVLDPVVERLPTAALERLGLDRPPAASKRVRGCATHLAAAVRLWATEPGAHDGGGAAVGLQQGVVLLCLLELHQALAELMANNSQHRAARAACEKALSGTPLCIYDDGRALRPREVYCDLASDLGPTVRAPPDYLQQVLHKPHPLEYTPYMTYGSTKDLCVASSTTCCRLWGHRESQLTAPRPRLSRRRQSASSRRVGRCSSWRASAVSRPAARLPTCASTSVKGSPSTLTGWCSRRAARRCGRCSRAWAPRRASLTASRLAVGESVINCPPPLNVLKDTYDHSCY
jgi:hypothetical protein